MCAPRSARPRTRRAHHRGPPAPAVAAGSRKRLRTLLRRELLHVADMLDPAFGYLQGAAQRGPDPAVVNLLRERYRVLWDATIDGRLCREGRLGAQARAARLAEFARAFPMLSESAEDGLRAVVRRARPTHAAIVAFIQEPRGAQESH